MARTHALQPRAGKARPINVRVSDADIARLSETVAAFQKQGVKLSTSDLVRSAVSDFTRRRERSDALIFTRLVEDLDDAGVRPILVGAWAIGAHGYLAPAASWDLVVRTVDVDSAQAFLAARGVAWDGRARIGIGLEPWQVTFVRDSVGVPAESLAVTPFLCGAVLLDVVTLSEALAAVRRADADAREIEGIEALATGKWELDDGERGMTAWDAIGRLTAGAWFADERTRVPHRFVDFSKVRR